jgi:uncharacterized protein
VAATSERFERLLTVQDHDTAIDQLVHRKANLPQRSELSGVEADLAQLRSRRDAVGSDRDVLGERQASIEQQITVSKSRSAEIERRLYGGQVTAARDLQAMDEEVRHLAKYVSELEDRELEVMVELEPLDAELSLIDAEMAGLDARGAQLGESIAMDEVEIDGKLAEERAARQASTEGLPPELLASYEQLRKKLGGTGAARLVGGSCGGCHLQLPAVELDRVKKADPDAVIYCDQCGRILVR